MGSGGFVIRTPSLLQSVSFNPSAKKCQRWAEAYCTLKKVNEGALEPNFELALGFNSKVLFFFLPLGGFPGRKGKHMSTNVTQRCSQQEDSRDVPGGFPTLPALVFFGHGFFRKRKIMVFHLSRWHTSRVFRWLCAGHSTAR